MSTTAVTYEIPEELLVEVAAILLEAEEDALRISGCDTRTSEALGHRACKLLAAALGYDGEEAEFDKQFYREPLVVEAFGRAYERCAEGLAGYVERQAEEAKLIRARGSVLPPEFFGEGEAKAEDG